MTSILFVDLVEVAYNYDIRREKMFASMYFVQNSPFASMYCVQNSPFIPKDSV